MGNHQTRRSISIRGTTYTLVADDCAARDLSLSEYVEGLVAADRASRGLSAPLPSIRAMVPVQLVVQAAPLPSESTIAVGPPPSQLKLPTRSTEGLRRAIGGQSPRPEEVAARRAQRHAAPPPIPFAKPASATASTRPAHSADQVPPPSPGRAARNVVMF